MGGRDPAVRRFDVTTLADFAGHAPLLERIAASGPGRLMVAIAGPPGAGKSSFAEALVETLNADATESAAVIPMDGFHYDDGLLEARCLRSRKGSPATFDVGGLHHMLLRLRARDEAEVAVPVFDRRLEISRAGARIVSAPMRILVIEGNYLLLNQEPWRQLAPLFDVTVMLRESRSSLEARLIQRWLCYGFSEAEARAKVLDNDLPNVDVVLEGSRKADFDIASNPLL
jgi:pantothenate kinase